MGEDTGDMTTWTLSIVLFLCIILLSFLLAGEADVIALDVSVIHTDEGWDHFADKWEVIGPDGSVLGTRILYHPHVNEQPYTRSLTGLKIPEEVTAVTIRAHDSIHEYGGMKKSVELPK